MNNPNDLKFLEDFPTLNDWLMMNGFSLVYSIENPEMNQIISSWSDRCTTDDESCPVQEISNDLMLIYCKSCKTVEVYARGFVGFKGSDGEIAEVLKDCVKNTVTDRVESVLEATLIDPQPLSF